MECGPHSPVRTVSPSDADPRLGLARGSTKGVVGGGQFGCGDPRLRYHTIGSFDVADSNRSASSANVTDLTHSTADNAAKADIINLSDIGANNIVADLTAICAVSSNTAVADLI